MAGRLLSALHPGKAMKPSPRVRKKPGEENRPLGIFGGIFDPVHNGHCAAACLARDYFSLDKVYLIPSGTPPHKSGSVAASPAHRLAMLKLAVKGCASLAVWEDEIRRPGISYTVDTIRRIREKHPAAPLYFIIGSDNLGEIVTWHKYRQILSSVTLCVAHRPGFGLALPPELGVSKILKFPSPEWSVPRLFLRLPPAARRGSVHTTPRAVQQQIRIKWYQDGDLQKRAGPDRYRSFPLQSMATITGKFSTVKR
jgi:nicotinate-nucleotide adenylyltransferase